MMPTDGQPMIVHDKDRKDRKVAALIALAASAMVGIGGPIPAFSGELSVEPFTAAYSVQYRGISAGNLDFILREKNGRYVYESIAHPKGLARLVVNNNLREASEFTVDNGSIKPQSYELDDGSSSIDDDTRLQMDWTTGKAKGMHEGKAIELALNNGMQDRMSAQVVIMQQLVAGREPSRLTFIDRDAAKEYSYAKIREEKLKTQLGELDTVVYESSRPGSNRISRLWYAPSLGFVPVRGEQQRKGKIETIFEIQTLQKP
jgi:hypothetical protein